MKKNIKTRPAFFALPRWCSSVTFFFISSIPTRRRANYLVSKGFRERIEDTRGESVAFFCQGGAFYLFF